MAQHQEKKSENKTSTTAANLSGGIASVQLKDNRQHAIVQQKLSLKTKGEELNAAPIQKKANNTGLPDQLKSGIENLSGHSMDDVKVHYNSGKPAQLQAHAYAQGTHIHMAPGQEKHLPHEAWHVVQQKQGRVKPTLQMKGKVNVNDDKGLENEADVMGAKALSIQRKEKTPAHHSGCGCAGCSSTAVANPVRNALNSSGVYQLMECGTCHQHNSHHPTCKHYQAPKVKKAKKAKTADIVGGSHNKGGYQKSGSGGDQHQKGFKAATDVEKRTGFYANVREAKKRT